MIHNFISNHQYLGIEFDWMGRDLEGKIGYFSTAGFGPIPEECQSNSGFYQDLFEEIIGLPVISEFQRLNGFDGYMLDWVEISRRGIYAFDWSRSLSKYQIISAPLNPLDFNDLRKSVSSLFVENKLNCNFRMQASDEPLITFDIT